MLAVVGWTGDRELTRRCCRCDVRSYAGDELRLVDKGERGLGDDVRKLDLNEVCAFRSPSRS
jgi:hypothetical protein